MLVCLSVAAAVPATAQTVEPRPQPASPTPGPALPRNPLTPPVPPAGPAAAPATTAPASPPPAQGAVTPAGLGCEAGGGVGGLLDGGVSGLVGGSVCSAANAVLGGLVSWVADSTLALITRVASFLDTSSQPQLRSEWFARQYRVMIQIALVTSLPLLLAAIVDGLAHRRTGEVVKAAFVSLPVAAVATAVAIPLIAMFVEIVDWLCALVADGVAQDAGAFLTRVGGLFKPSNPASAALPPFVLLVAAILGLFAAFVVWVELLFRELAIYLVAFFFPLSAATLVWRRVARWCTRCLRTLAAVILSKFFIVAVISLGAAALGAAGPAIAPAGTAATAAGAVGGGFETVMAGVALLLMATFAPWVCFRLLAPVEGAAMEALHGAALGSATGAATGVAGRLLGGSGAAASGNEPGPTAGGGAAGGAASRTAGGPGQAVSRVSPAQANAAAAAAALPLAGVRSAQRAVDELPRTRTDVGAPVAPVGSPSPTEARLATAPAQEQ